MIRRFSSKNKKLTLPASNKQHSILPMIKTPDKIMAILPRFYWGSLKQNKAKKYQRNRN